MMNSQWLLKAPPSQENQDAIESALGVPATIAFLLAQRGIHSFDQAKRFFRPDLSELHDPFLLKGMDKAVKRILHSIEKDEKILVYGDYDVDGTTSVSMMYSFLKQLHENIVYYIPNRYDEGYGVSTQGISFAAENEVKLIISLDCGIKAVERVAEAKEKGIDFIICDHHLPGKVLPDAVAILDPKQSDCSYPYDGLSGCGVGFKLIQALGSTLNMEANSYLNYLDLVAISTAADIVPMTGENRILVHYGLERLRKKPRLGVKMLLPKDQHPNQLNVSKIVFSVAPKINAAGRIDHANGAVQLLTCTNKLSARAYLSNINALNSTRKDIDAQITASAIRQLEEKAPSNRFSNIVYDPNWQKGVIGIVASRLIELYYHPTVVFTKGEDDILVASVRSVKGFNVYEALKKCSDLLERFGGHKYAAGLSMKLIHLPEFKRRFEEVVKASIQEQHLTPSLDIDAEIGFDTITPKFVRLLKQFEPFGPGHMTPVFLTRNVRSAGNEQLIGRDKKHLKMNVFQPQTRKILSTIGFGMGKHFERIQNEPFDLVYSIEENYWQNKAHLQLQLKDLRFV